MKEGKKIANICAIILVLFSVAATIVATIFDWDLAFIAELLFIGGVCLVRFSYEIACFRNAWHAIWYKKDSSGDDEPSGFAIAITKIMGYILMFSTALSLVVGAIFY